MGNRLKSCTAVGVMVVLAGVVSSARAQESGPGQTPTTGAAAQPAGGPTPLGPFWLAAGGGMVTARGHCSGCDRDGVYLTSGGLFVDGGVRVTPRVDAGIEVSWVSSEIEGTSAVRTTFVLGLGQFRPWVDRGFLIRAGMGMGFAGNGLYNPFQPALKPPYTTNALALSFGIGWVFRRERRLAFQVQGAQYVVAIGELTLVDGTTISNVVGNYWMVTGALVIR